METTQIIYTKSRDFLQGKYLTIFGIFILVGVATGLVDWIGQFFSKETTWADLYTSTGFSVQLITLVLISTIFSLVTSMMQGLSNILPLYFIKDAKSGVQLSVIGVIKKYWKEFWPVFLITIVSGGIVALGVVLFVIPGIMLAILLSLSMYARVTKNTTTWDSLTYSWAIVSGRKWELVKKSVSGFVKINLKPILIAILLFILFPIITTSVMLAGISRLLVYIFFGVMGVYLAYLLVRASILFLSYTYHLFEEFERTAVKLDETQMNVLRDKLKKYFWISVIVGVIVLGVVLKFLPQIIDFVSDITEYVENS